MGELFLTSRLIPVPHGFSIRTGGCSEGPHASLDLGIAAQGVESSRVEENWTRMAREVGRAPADFRTALQVHGARVLRAGATTGGGGTGGEWVPDERVGALAPREEADAICTWTEGLAVGVRTADCVPILLVDVEGKSVAAVHSGWRGTDLRISARAVEALVGKGGGASSLRAAIGPCIQVCCYAVSAELAERFRASFGEDVARQREGQWYLDLSRAVRKTLNEAGLASEQIETLERCTSCEAERFFSHRRDKGVTGRHLSFAVCRF